MKEQGVILVSYGSRGVVQLDDGRQVACMYRRSVGRPYCGDRVALDWADDESAVVTAIHTRTNEFARADARGRKQVVAANLDRILVVIAPAPEPSRDLVERYLVAAQSLGIRPVIVVNKAELLANACFDASGPLGRLDQYRELGYDVFETSCKGPPGTAGLQHSLQEKTSILAGQSGVGKSSLVNQLIPDLDLQTGALSKVTGKGTHTTTTTIMYALPCGGTLIDSPGVWEYGLWQLDREELADGFIDFRSASGNCRFNNCRHSGEPGCAVKQAVDEGDIRDWRYQSYLRLLEQAGL